MVSSLDSIVNLIQKNISERYQKLVKVNLMKHAEVDHFQMNIDVSCQKRIKV